MTMSARATLASRLIQSAGLLPPASISLATASAVTLGHCDDPSKMSAESVVREILHPAATAGWVGVTPDEVIRKCATMPLAQVREWGASTLKAHPWVPGEHIPDLFEFITSESYLGEGTPTKRQIEVFQKSIGGGAEDWFVRKSKTNLLVLCWGKGCLAAGEMIRDHSSGETKTVEEWEMDGSPILVQSRDTEGSCVLRWASPVYLKGRAQLYRVVLSDGRSFRATAEHRCLTRDGWKHVRELSTGDSLQAKQRFSMNRKACPEPSKTGRGDASLCEGLGDAVCFEDREDVRWQMSDPTSTGQAARIPSGTSSRPSRQRSVSSATGIVPGSLPCCHPSRRFYGEPLHGVRDSVQCGAPLQGDAPVHIHASLEMDGCLVPSRECTQTCRRSDLHSGGASLSDTLSVSSPPRSVSGLAGETPLGCQGVQTTPGQSSLLCSCDESLRCRACGSCDCPQSLNHYAEIVGIEPDGQGDFYDLTVSGTECYYDSSGILHHNSGKDWLSSCLLAYVSFCVAKMRNPWFHFDVMNSTVLDCINVAESKKQAQEVFFTYLTRMLQRDCFATLLDRRPGVGIKSDTVTFKRSSAGRSGEVAFLRILSLNSRGEAVEGKNTFFWVMDEADAFRTAEGHANAHDMFKKLTSSNRFGDRQLGVIISYPRTKGGFILQKISECGNRGGPVANAWGDLAATYEVLPFKTFIPCGPVEDPDNPGVIWQEAFTNPAGNVSRTADMSMRLFYEQDIETYRAVYECNPPSVENAFISQESKIAEAVQAWRDACLTPLATFEDYVSETHVGGVVHHYSAKRMVKFNPRPGVAYFMACDAGKSQDSFALSVFHIIPAEESGYICPACWTDRKKRLSKHYKPDVCVRAMYDENPGAWACDHCRMVPVKDMPFWGVARFSGMEVVRPVYKTREVRDDDTGQTYSQIVYSASGEPVHEFEEVMEGGKPIRRQKVERVVMPFIVEDLLIEWVPDKRRGIVVDFHNVTEIIMELNRTRQIAFCRADQWQAEEKIQVIRKAGIAADTRQLSNPEQLRMYRNYKDALYSNRILLMPNPERDRQLRDLQLINGTKIDHPSQGSDGTTGKKDLTDAEAICILLAHEMGGRRAEVINRPSVDVAGVPAMVHAKRVQKSTESIVDGVLRSMAR